MNTLQKRAKALKNKKGFTLIELIVVIVIIGILAAIVVPRVTSFTAESKIKADVATARTIATALAAYEAKEGVEAPDLDSLVTAGFLGSTPVSQTDPETDFTYDYDAADGIEVYVGAETFYPYTPPAE